MIVPQHSNVGPALRLRVGVLQHAPVHEPTDHDHAHGLSIDGTNPWVTLRSSVAWDGARMRIRQDEVLQPDGSPGTYTYVELPWDVVVVVPVDDQGRVHLVRQWRYPWGRNSWEIPAGHCEPDEDPLNGARRELAEEVGLSARAWQHLGTGYSSAAFNARYHVYLAKDLEPIEEGGSTKHVRDGSELDMIQTALPLEEALEAASDGTIIHALSVVALQWANRALSMAR